MLCLWSRMSDSLILVLLSFCLAIAVNIMFLLLKISILYQWWSLLTPKYGENMVNKFVLMIILFANIVLMFDVYCVQNVYWVILLSVFFFCDCICCIVILHLKGMCWCTFFCLQFTGAICSMTRTTVSHFKQN